jgi:hypothetical protein
LPGVEESCDGWACVGHTGRDLHFNAEAFVRIVRRELRVC